MSYFVGKKNVFYWKSSKGNEVDFVIVEDTKAITAIQVSYSIEDAMTEERELRSLDAAYSELGIRDLMVVTRSERRDIKRKDYTIKVRPIIEFLVAQSV